MAKTETKEVVAAGAAIPSFLAAHMGDTRGSEEVGSQDLVIPRIELVQALSSARKKSEPGFIEGASEGMLYNSVTRELYGEHMTIIPVYFGKEWLLWRDQKVGGGFAGAFKTEAEALAALEGQEKPEEWEATETNQHFCLVVKEDGSLEEAVVSMAKTKSKASRLLNSLVRINGGPRFSRQYALKGVADQNGAGQEYYTLSVSNCGFVTEPQFEKASELYEMIKSGAAKASTDFEHEVGSGAADCFDAEM